MTHIRNFPQNEPNGFRLQSIVVNNKSETTSYYCGEKGHCMGDCQVNKKAGMIKKSEASKFGNFAACEEQYKPTGECGC